MAIDRAQDFQKGEVFMIQEEDFDQDEVTDDQDEGDNSDDESNSESNSDLYEELNFENDTIQSYQDLVNDYDMD